MEIPEEFYLVIAQPNDGDNRLFVFEQALLLNKPDVWNHLEDLTGGWWPALTYKVMLVENNRLVDVTDKFQFEERWDKERGSYTERADERVS